MASLSLADMLCDSSGASNTRAVLGDFTSSSTAAGPCRTPGPYVKGMVLDLPVNWTRGTPPEEQVLFTVTEVFEVTMFSVMKVQWASGSGKAHTAILKLFDRRYGHESRGYRLTCHNAALEACWQQYVQSGQAPGFFEHIKEKDNEGDIFYSSNVDPVEAEMEGTVDTREVAAKKEGLVQYRALECLNNEIRAYKQLEKLQGKCVPLFYGTTSFSLAPHGLDPQFFRVGGILIEYIDGFTLNTLSEPDEASPDIDYQGIIHRVVKVAEDVNACGVVTDDCVPENMLIQTGTMQPFEFDFYRCSFREDFASEEEWNENVRYSSNATGYGKVMARRLNRKFKLGVGVKYGATELEMLRFNPKTSTSTGTMVRTRKTISDVKPSAGEV